MENPGGPSAGCLGKRDELILSDRLKSLEQNRINANLCVVVLGGILYANKVEHLVSYVHEGSHEAEAFARLNYETANLSRIIRSDDQLSIYRASKHH